MTLPPDPLTPKRDYFAQKIREYARRDGVSIEDVRWTRAADGEGVELSIRGAGHERRYRLPETDDPPLPGLSRLTPNDLDLLADNLGKGWQ